MATSSWLSLAGFLPDNRMARFIPVIGNQIAALLLGLLGLKLFTRYVSPEVNGYYQVYFLSLCQIGSLLTHPGLVNHASRYWQREKPAGRDYLGFLWVESWKRTGWVMLATGLIMIPAARSFSWYEVSWIWSAAGLCSVLLAIQAGAVLIINSAESHWMVLGVNTLASATRSLLPLLMVAVFGASL